MIGLTALTLATSFLAGEARLNLRPEILEGEERKTGADQFCTSPHAKEKVNFPEKIVGRAPMNFDSYSGYVNVTSEDWLFYWFFENADGNPDAPLIIWTNGGPGCSSMEGATTENGPLVLFDIKEACSSGDCDYTEQFSLNPYSWNAHANLLYLDQPRYVGYSFGYGPKVKSSVEAADDFVTFYQGWLELFPEFKGRELIISGESYGGHYVPAWANAILDFNENQVDDSSKINFAGAVIGNGCVNNTVQNTQEYIEFLHEENLIPADSNPKNYGAASLEMVKHLGYTPNYYDYRTESISCNACYGYNYTAWAHWFLKDEIEQSLNVCGDAGVDAFEGSAGGCIALPGFDSDDKFDYSGALGRTLNAGIPVVLYYGKTDTACNYVGGLTLANTISWNSQAEFAAAPLGPMEIAGIEAGQAKSVNGLTYIQVESAGHMVPLDQPASSAMAIGTILLDINQKKKH